MANITEKFSFAEMIDNLDAKKVNSDLENLANALMALKAAKQKAAKYVKDVEALEAEIAELGAAIDGGDIVEVGAVKDLYDEAHKLAQVRL